MKIVISWGHPVSEDSEWMGCRQGLHIQKIDTDGDDTPMAEIVDLLAWRVAEHLGQMIESVATEQPWERDTRFFTLDFRPTTFEHVDETDTEVER